jgi:molecular chaperone GrpE (heat shock protein)
MRRKFILLSLVLSLILIVAGGAALSWVFIGQRSERQRLREQQESFDARLHELDRVVAGEIDVRSFATAVPSEDQLHRPFDNRAATEKREFVVGVAGVCISAGGAIAGFWLLLWTTRLLMKGFSFVTCFFTRSPAGAQVTGDEQSAEVNGEKDEKAPKRGKDKRQKQKQLKKGSKMAADSGWHSSKASFAGQYEPAPLENLLSSFRSGSHFDGSVQDPEKLAVLLTNGEPAEGAPKVVAGSLNLNTARAAQLSNTGQGTDPLDSQNNHPELEDLFRTQTENLEKQMKEFKQMAKTVQKTTLEHSKPLKSNLNELMQQVSAIREYALQQQGRMEKLQDGYDWNIVRTFCLRVIRCIDNLETRIARLSKENIETTDLEQVRDEMIFALESSGVERFEPEINSEYRGQERKAEAVKGRKSTDDRELTGKIAQVVRPGYQYVIDDENVKVVRTARVKLFG